MSYDWSRVVNTSEPDYYRWTQVLFLDLLEAGLLERRETEVAWCDGCETALARMQADHGRCWRCSRKVGNKTLPQWFVKLSKTIYNLENEYFLLALPRLTNTFQSIFYLSQEYSDLTYGEPFSAISLRTFL